MPKTITVFDYSTEVEPLICKHLGIEQEEFNGDFIAWYNDKTIINKDYWKVFIRLHEDSIKGNDSYFRLRSDLGVQYQDGTYWHDMVAKEFGDWATPLLAAIDNTATELQASLQDGETSITVWISW